MAKRFRKRQVEVEAVQWTGENREAVEEFLRPGEKFRTGPFLEGPGGSCGIERDGTVRIVKPTAFLVRDHSGALAVVGPQSFQATYEPAGQDRARQVAARLRQAAGPRTDDPVNVSVAVQNVLEAADLLDQGQGGDGLKLGADEILRIIARALLYPEQFTERHAVPDLPEGQEEPDEETRYYPEADASFYMRAIRVALGLEAGGKIDRQAALDRVAFKVASEHPAPTQPVVDLGLLTDEKVREITKQIVEGSDGEVLSLPYSVVRDAITDVLIPGTEKKGYER